MESLDRDTFFWWCIDWRGISCISIELSSVQSSCTRTSSRMLERQTVPSAYMKDGQERLASSQTFSSQTKLHFHFPKSFFKLAKCCGIWGTWITDCLSIFSFVQSAIEISYLYLNDSARDLLQPHPESHKDLKSWWISSLERSLVLIYL